MNFSRSLRPLVLLCSCALYPLLYAAEFTDPSFVEETIYQGNGMISMAFDHGGRLYVQEKQGRVLMLEPNPSATNFEVAYEYYEGSWNNLPDFDTLTPVKSGVQNSFSLSPAEQNDFYAFRYTATLPITTAGTYTFYLASDDGSRLWINDVLVVNHDGLHGASEMSGTIALPPGEHDLRVEYFEKDGGQSLTVQFAGPGITKQPLAGAFGDFLPPVVFLDVSSAVYTNGECGMMGLALDPDYANNRYLYTLYTTPIDQRLTRFTANASFTGIVPGSETILLSGFPNTNNVHKAGDIAFHPDEPFNIYVMLGDDGNRNIVGSLTNYNGKILRVDSTTGQGLTTNPYYDGNPDSIASRVWSARYRNPFRFAFDPAAPISDVLYISENGDGTDRLARIKMGADGGWDNAFTTSSAESPVPWRKILRTTQPSLTAVTIVRGGPFAPDGPAIYNARYGGDDRKEIRRWYLTGEHLDTLTEFEEDAGEPFLSNYTSFNIVDFEMGPDGAMYFTDSNQGSSTGTGYRLGRIRHVGGTPPVASFTLAPDTEGVAEFAVQFTDTSTAPDSTLASWTWDFGDGAVSNAQSPLHTYTQAGVYEARLTVTNAQGLTSFAATTITAYRQVTLQLSGQIHDARALAAMDLPVPTELRFYEQDGVTPALVTGGVGPDANAVLIPAGGEIDVNVVLRLTSDRVVVSAGEAEADGFEAAFAGLELTQGEASVAEALEFYLSTTMLRGRVRDTRGAAASVDVGLSLGEPDAAYAMPHGRDLLSGPPAGAAHRVVADEMGFYHFPVRLPDAGTTAFVGTGADTQTSVYAAVGKAVYLPARSSRVLDFVVGLYNGGIGEDDLSGLIGTPDVDFEADVQTILTANCAACHNEIATNSGGLDLEPGDSLGELVSRFSTEAPGVKLVEPGAPARSYLMEKISSAQPQVGTRMRPNDPMPLAQQAIIWDWIAQLGGEETIRFTSAQFTVAEGTSTVNAEISLERTGTGSGGASVTLATLEGTAVAGVDFTAVSTSVNWGDGETGERTVNIPILADTLAESLEWVDLTLSQPSGAILDGPSHARLFIQDRPMDAWRAETFGTTVANTAPAQPSADFEGDTVLNVVEYGLAGNPLAADLAHMAGSVQAGVGEVLFDFPYNFAATDVDFRVLGALELEPGGAGWQELATKDGAAPWATETGVDLTWDPITGMVRVALDPVALGIENQVYLKLEVTVP